MNDDVPQINLSKILVQETLNNLDYILMPQFWLMININIRATEVIFFGGEGG